MFNSFYFEILIFHRNRVNINVFRNNHIFIPPLPEGGGGRRVYCFTSEGPFKIFFVAFFSATIDDRNLIFGHKHHIGMPYCGKRFWTRQIPTSCLPKSGGIIGEH
jgi:hypothetical protein